MSPSFCGEGRVVCLPPCVLIVRVRVMVSFDSLSFSVRHRGRFVGFAQDEFCFFGSEFTANGRVLPMFGAVDCLFSTLGSCTRRSVQVIFFFEYSSAELVFSVGSRFLMSIGATIFFGGEPTMLSSPSGSVPIIVACERRRCGPQSRC